MSPDDQFRSILAGPRPFLTLAPMQEVTDGAFWTLVHRYGGADVYWTEYFRVHAESTPEKRILDAITQNSTGRPVVAQMIGNDIPALVRTATVLQRYPVAAIDLNLGCPAPIVYRKCAGGGLLREPQRIDAILGALREAVRIPFTVKTRLGFASTAEFDQLLPIFARHGLDALTVHARTVAQLYRLPVHYERIRQAVDVMPCPVIANGHVYSAAQAEEVIARTGAHGLMIGRAAIRSPWLFAQIRQQLAGQPVIQPTGREVWRLRARAVGLAGLVRQAREGAVRPDEEVRQLPGRGRAAAVPRSHPPRADRRRVPPHLRRGLRSRPADGARASRPARTHPDRDRLRTVRSA